MKLKYLGTSAADGVPALFCECDLCKRARALGGKNIRTRCQALVDGKILLDFPPDTYTHTLIHNLSLGEIKTCLISHAHADHLYPKDFIMRNPLYTHRKDDSVPLSVYAGKQGCSALHDLMDPLPKEQQTVAICEVCAFETFEAEGYTITPLPASHAPTTSPYLYLIEKEGKAIFYGHDSGFLKEETIEYLKNRNKPLNLVSLDCTMGTMDTDGKSHLNVSGCEKVKAQFLDLGIADENTIFVLAHFSHNGGDMVHDELAPFVQKKGLIAAYDGMEIEI